MTDFYFVPYMKKPLVALKSHLFVLKNKTMEYYENTVPKIDILEMIATTEILHMEYFWKDLVLLLNSWFKKKNYIILTIFQFTKQNNIFCR